MIRTASPETRLRFVLAILAAAMVLACADKPRPAPDQELMATFGQRLQEDAKYPRDLETATYSIVQFGTEAIPTIESILETVEDGAYDDHARRLLELIDEDVLDSLMKNARTLPDEALVTIAGALFMKGWTGELTDSQVQFLVAQLEHANERVRSSALISLSLAPVRRLSLPASAIPTLRAMLDDPPPDLHEGGSMAMSVAIALAHTGPEARPVLMEATAHHDPEVRRVAILGLGDVARDDARAAEDLLRLLQSEDDEIAIAACRQLPTWQLQSESAVEVLLRAAREMAPEYRWCPAKRLGEFGSDAASSIPVLLGLLDEGNRGLALYSAEALGRMAPASLDTILALIDDQETRAFGARALSEAGEHAIPIAPRLEPWLDDKDHDARCEAATAFWRIGWRVLDAYHILIEDCGHAYVEILVHPTSRTKKAMTGLIRELGEPAYLGPIRSVIAEFGAQAVPFLIEAMRSPDPRVRKGACDCLGEIGAEATPATNTLREALQDNDRWVRMLAARALADIGPPDPVAVGRELVAALRREQDPAVKPDLFRALVSMGPAPTGAIPLLEQELVNEDPNIRHEALSALVKLHRQDVR